MKTSIPFTLDIFPEPERACCEYHIRVDCNNFEGNHVLDKAFFLKNRTLKQLFLYDLDFFEENQKNNFILCTNGNVDIYKQYKKLFNLDINLYTCKDIKHVDNITYLDDAYFDTIKLNQRWMMKHQMIITESFSFKKIIFYNNDIQTVRMIYEYSNIDKWCNEGFVFINVTTTPIENLISIIRGAETIICASQIDYFLTVYCKENSNVFLITNENNQPPYYTELNRHYKKDKQIYNIHFLLQHDTFNDYKKIAATLDV